MQLPATIPAEPADGSGGASLGATAPPGHGPRHLVWQRIGVGITAATYVRGRTRAIAFVRISHASRVARAGRQSAVGHRARQQADELGGGVVCVLDDPATASWRPGCFGRCTGRVACDALTGRLRIAGGESPSLREWPQCFSSRVASEGQCSDVLRSPSSLSGRASFDLAHRDVRVVVWNPAFHDAHVATNGEVVGQRSAATFHLLYW